MTSAFPIGAALILAAGPLPAAAQYRPNMPATLPAPPVADPDAPGRAVLAGFSNWAASRRPTLLIYWDRQLTDETTTRFVKHKELVDETRSHASADKQSTRTQFGSAEVSNGDKVDRRVASLDEEVRPIRQGQYSSMGAAASDVLETVFTNVFLASGARLVDRTALTRALAADADRSDRGDLQQLEGLGLKTGADYLIQVLPSAGPSDTRLSFSVKVIHLPTHSTVARFITAARPPNAPARYVATSHGYEKRSESRVSAERVAGQLALEVMRRFPSG